MFQRENYFLLNLQFVRDDLLINLYITIYLIISYYIIISDSIIYYANMNNCPAIYDVI
jgi:hypothetical protein